MMGMNLNFQGFVHYDPHEAMHAVWILLRWFSRNRMNGAFITTYTKLLRSLGHCGLVGQAASCTVASHLRVWSSDAAPC